MRPRQRPAAIGLVALVAGAVLLIAVPPAAPAEPAPDPTAPGVTLVSQPPWVPTEGAQVMVLHLDDPALRAVRGAAVEIAVHDSVSSRTSFNDAVSGAALGSTRTRMTFPLSSTPPNRQGDFLIGFGLSGSGAPRSVAVDREGVYPVEVGMVGDGQDRSTFVTWMVVVDTEARAEPLRVSWIWRLIADPLHLAGSGVNRQVLASMHPGGRLDDIATLLARAGSLPLTLAIGPETLQSWAKLSRATPALRPGVARVQRAAARSSTQLLPEPYVPIDGPTIESEGLGPQVPDQYVAGSHAIEQVTDRIPDPRTAFVDPVDDATVNRLTQMLVGRFVVRDAALVPIEQPLTPTQPFTLTTPTGVSAPAFATDSGIELLAESDGPSALRAQRVVAALSEIAYEAPSRLRGVVLTTPDDWAPDIGTVSLVMRALRTNPLLKPTTLDDAFAEVPPEERDGGPLQRQLAPHPVNDSPPLFATEYDAAQRDLDAYASMVGKDDPAVAAGEHALLLALSTSNTREQALAQLESIHAGFDHLAGGIKTTVKRLTLTARRAELPLSFQNDTKRAGVRVRVRLDSPKLVFPDGNETVLELPIGHYTKRFAVEARASGTFAMTITMESADGTLALGPPTRVTIRSAVFSGIGIALTLGALLFLAGWWGNHYWRTRRARRRASTL